MPALTDLSTIRDLCARYDFALSKGFGQNFIINPGVCPRIAEAAGIGPGWGALEVGPLQLQVVQNNLGDGSGGHVEGLGPRHGEGGGVIPVGDVLGNLNGGLDLRAGGQQALRRGLLIGRLGQSGDLLPGRLDHVGHGSISFSIHLSVCRAAGRRAG